MYKFIMPPKELKEDLRRLEKISLKGLMIAIPTSEILQYYIKEITHCQFSTTKIHLEVRVPIKKANSDWKLFQYTPIFFRHDDELDILNTDQMLISCDLRNCPKEL